MGSFGPWQIKRSLGLGGFGDVHLWKNVTTGQHIAIKMLKENSNLSIDEIAKLQQRWTQEREWMMHLQTPYIVRGLNDQLDPRFINYLTERHAWRPLEPIVMEYCNCGDLRTQLQLVENTNGLSEFEVREVLYALRHAIEFLHTKCRIEHRDLKPDNVVIHENGGRRVYKLTDFGFARSITENTMLKSIVGTRNYVAPEVLDTAEYKNTVDYWSLGIIAYEIICGNLPFIPHQELFNIITNIRKKQTKCIAITEDVSEKKFIFHDKIASNNRMSIAFLNKIESWLTTALDQNYHTRGTRPDKDSTKPTLTFYTELDVILSQKVLTVFSLSTLTFYAWEVSADMTLRDFRELVRTSTGIENVFCIFPTGHPRATLSPTYKPIDFFVEEWQQNRYKNSPPVMLYIKGPNAEYNVSGAQIPVCIKKYLNTKVEIPKWLLNNIEQSTHYLLNTEQYCLEAFVHGLKEYALTIEHEIFHYDTDNKDNKLQQYFSSLNDMNGRIEQFYMNINAAKESCMSQIINCESFFNDWLSKASKFKRNLATLEDLKTKVKRYYKSGLRRAKEMATNPIFDDLKNKDVYKLLEFRRQLETSQKVKMNDMQRLKSCRTAVYDCLCQRQKVMNSEHLKYAYSTITSVQLEFEKLKEIVSNSMRQLHDMQSTLAHSTVDFNKKIINIYKGYKTQPHILSDNISSLLINSESCNSIDDLLQRPVSPLIEEVRQMITKMEIDDQDLNKPNEIPATIEQ